MHPTPSKIALVSFSLGSGGAERFAGTLSFMLEGLGYEVHHILVNPQVDYPHAGKVYILAPETEHSGGWWKKVQKGMLLRRYLKKHQIHTIIDNRTRNHFWRELMTLWLYGPRKTFYMVHSYQLENYFPKSSFWGRRFYRKAYRIVAVSKAIASEIQRRYQLTNTTVIYNPVQTIAVKPQVVTLPEKYVLFFGRLDEKTKNLTLLLRAFKQSGVYEHGYQLLLLGDGPDKNTVLKNIQALDLTEHVQVMPFQKDPFYVVQQAQFTVLSSRYEGFPMSIIEALSLGIPVVSVDCPSGPNELIIHEQNGLLVPNHDISALGLAIYRMATDDEFRFRCHRQAAASVAHLSMQNIAAQWQELLASSEH